MEHRIIFRYFREPAPNSVKGIPTGLVCAVEFEGDQEYHLGYAYCHPKDQFNCAVGRKLALERALMDVPRETRREVWKTYHERGLSDRCE